MSKTINAKEIRETLRQNLKFIRKGSGLIQEDFSKKINVNRKRYASWEEGRGVPPLDVILFISESFQIEIKLLLTVKLWDQQK